MKWLAAIALLFAAAVAGYAFHGDRDAGAITAAESATAVCHSALDSQKAALADVRKQLADLRERHDLAKRAAEKVLAEREAENTALGERVAALTESLRKSAHADASCAPLARLAVCSAVAGRLWPAATEAAADSHTD